MGNRAACRFIIVHTAGFDEAYGLCLGKVMIDGSHETGTAHGWSMESKSTSIMLPNWFCDVATK